MLENQIFLGKYNRWGRHEYIAFHYLYCTNRGFVGIIDWTIPQFQSMSINFTDNTYIFQLLYQLNCLESDDSFYFWGLCVSQNLHLLCSNLKKLFFLYSISQGCIRLAKGSWGRIGKMVQLFHEYWLKIPIFSWILEQFSSMIHYCWRFYPQYNS